MVSPVFNSDPQQSMVHQPESATLNQQAANPLCNDFGGQPYQPQHAGKRDQGFDGEAYRKFMRELG